MGKLVYDDLVPFDRKIELPKDWEPDLLLMGATIECMIHRLSLDKDQKAEFFSIFFGKDYPVFERNDGG